MKRVFFFRITAIIFLSVTSLCLRSEKMACTIKNFSITRPVQVINNTEATDVENKAEGILPYYPLIIKI